MPDRADILWFKRHFQSRIESALAGTPLTVDMIVAIACQETGHIWPLLRRKSLPPERVLALCVGDTLDADRGRRAFPRDKAELLSRPGGERMFAIARQALLDMSQHVPGYAAAAARAHKFCHGFGVFQRDLQFFLDDPDYFLGRRYEDFDASLALCVAELKRGLRKTGLEGRERLSDMELAAVGIAYNTGGYRPAKGLRQGYFNGSQYYGEALFDYLRLAQTVALPSEEAALVAPPRGEAIVPRPTPPSATGPRYRVRTREGMLRLRSAPVISAPPTANVIAHLPDGHPVRALAGKPEQGFLEIETSLQGALLRGFAAASLLVREPGEAEPVVVLEPASAPPGAGIVAAALPRPRGRVTRRSEPASAHALNEPGQPRRRGRSAAELAAGTRRHRRLARRRRRCARALPAAQRPHFLQRLRARLLPPRRRLPAARVVVRAGAAGARRGRAGRAADRGHGERDARERPVPLARRARPPLRLAAHRHPDKLQQAANQGAVALIVARRKEDGRSGHIAAVVPEGGDWRARRDGQGEVTSPLQSQAGAGNFRRGHGRPRWWLGPEFADSAYWIHA